MTLSIRSVLLGALVSLLVLPGCSLGTEAEPQLISDLVIVSGDAQTAPPGTLLPQPLIVQVNDPDGKGIKGVRVSWEVIVGNGTVSSLITTTGDNGQVGVRYTLGSVPGVGGVQASIFERGAEDIMVFFGADGIP